MSEFNKELTTILEHLPGWKLDPKFDGCVWRVAVDEEGHGLHFNLHNARLIVSGTNWPRDTEGHTYYPENGNSITVSRAKRPAIIADEINRRLLGWYLQEWEKHAVECAEANQRYAKIAGVRTRLVNELGCRNSPQSHRLYGPNGTIIDVQGPDSIRLECRCNFTVKQIKAILKIINKAEAKDA